MDLSDLALEVVEQLAPLAAHSGLALSVGTLPELLVDSNGDRGRLNQMLGNLVENALKYTAGVGAAVRVETRARRDGWVWVRVSDDGPGITDAHLPHLFDRIYRIDAARGGENEARQGTFSAESEQVPADVQTGGSGLGLAIAEWVAVAHGGEIRVRSEVGRGPTFEVWLPLA